MDRRGATTESSLSDGASLQSISAAIKQHHLHESIFHLLIINSIILKFVINRAGTGWCLPPKQVFCPRCSGDRGGAEDRGGLKKIIPWDGDDGGDYFCGRSGFLRMMSFALNFPISFSILSNSVRFQYALMFLNCSQPKEFL